MLKHTMACSALSLSLATAHAAPVLLDEGFDDVAALQADGWVVQNNSAPVGSTGWFQGNSGIFPAASGAADAYIAANFNNTVFGGLISHWLLTPTLALGDGDVLSFAYRGPLENPYFDVLEIYVSTHGASTDVGNTPTSVGDFALLASYTTRGQATSVWNSGSVTLSGLGDFNGRLGFRYVVDGFDANYLGLDKVLVTAAEVPEPRSVALLGLGLGLLGLVSARRRTLTARGARP